MGGNNTDDSLGKLMGGPADGGSITQWFDAVLAAINAQVNAILPAVQRAMAPPPLPSAAEQNAKAISEIERQLFLQFLMSELRFMKTHRILKAMSIYIRVEHDRRECARQQEKISDALSKLTGVGKSAAVNAILNAQRGQTIVTLMGMELQEKEVTAMLSLDDLFDNREEGIVRRLLRELLDEVRNDDSEFDPSFAWKILQDRWANWANTRPKRIRGLKKLWAATGGGKDFDSDPAGYTAITDYYKSIYAQIDAGGLSAVWALADDSL